jgi:hypothetical protein
MSATRARSSGAACLHPRAESAKRLYVASISGA